MPAPKDQTMLRLDSQKVLVAMAENVWEPLDLAEAAEIPVNLVYIARRGYHIKPKYAGKIARALGVSVTDLIAT